MCLTQTIRFKCQHTKVAYVEPCIKANFPESKKECVPTQRTEPFKGKRKLCGVCKQRKTREKDGWTPLTEEEKVQRKKESTKKSIEKCAERRKEREKLQRKRVREQKEKGRAEKVEKGELKELTPEEKERRVKDLKKENNRRYREGKGREWKKESNRKYREKKIKMKEEKKKGEAGKDQMLMGDAVGRDGDAKMDLDGTTGEESKGRKVVDDGVKVDLKTGDREEVKYEE